MFTGTESGRTIGTESGRTIGTESGRTIGTESNVLTNLTSLLTGQAEGSEINPINQLVVGSKGSLERFDTPTQILIRKVYDYITTDRSSDNYEQYLQFLTSIGNTNLQLINHETYLLFRALRRKGALTADFIAQEISQT